MKNGRHRKILEIIREHDIETQDELIGRLAECGYIVTQATVSRDIKDLRLVKIPSGSGHYKYSETGCETTVNSSKFINMFADNAVSVDRGQNVVCIKCLTGMAQAVCASFDKLNWENIVGTLAGEDTVFILCRTEKAAQELAAEMEKMRVR
ncbi:MAG: arginine repressor [Firmicutes bacterium]|nr:arginine repressor [Bacillota bacterium]